VNEKIVNLGLWDTAGQDDYDRLRPLSYPQTDCFLICYSTISPSSLANVTHKWYPEDHHHVPNAPIVLVGTKLDLTTDGTVLARLEERNLRPVSFAEADVVAKSINAAKHIQVSAFTREGVKQCFEECVRSVLFPAKAKVQKSKKSKCAIF
jgi:small GTP-binding protein